MQNVKTRGRGGRDFGVREGLEAQMGLHLANAKLKKQEGGSLVRFKTLNRIEERRELVGGQIDTSTEQGPVEPLLLALLRLERGRRIASKAIDQKRNREEER